MTRLTNSSKNAATPLDQLPSDPPVRLERMAGAAKRIVFEIAGWALLLVGIAAIFLPGPGLLAMFAGLALLSRQYDWADRRVEPVRLRALRGAAHGVASWLRILGSLGGIATLVACGVLWIVKPPTPPWWFLPDAVWLPGGLWTGVTQIASGAIALALLVYAYRRFHGKPEALAELDTDIDEADAEAEREREAHRSRRGDSDSRAGMR